MENLEFTDATIRPLSNCSMQSSSDFNGTADFGNDATFDEKHLLDDIDSYMEDIKNRLIISRMVSDSVIKGMVGAISEEAAEKVASKEAELTFLNERLCSYACNMHRAKEIALGVSVEPKRKKFGSQLNFHNLGMEQNQTQEHLVKLKLEAEEQIQRLKKEVEDVKGCNLIGRTNLDSIEQGKMFEKGMEMNKNIDALQSILETVYEQINNLVIMSNALLSEKEWESMFQEEVDGIIFQSLIWCLSEEFEEKSREQSRLFSSQHKNLMTKVDELSSLRQELDAISRSLFAPGPGKLSSYGSHELVEEWSNTERKDRNHRKALENHLSHPSSLQEENCIASEKSKESKDILPDATESALLHMSKHELINHFKDDIGKMKRNHEAIVLQKTEEYYRLKREYLKEKDSSNWRKDKEYDALRKKIPEVILKLENILVENEKLSMVCDDYKNIYGLKVRADNLLFENQRPRAMLIDKRKEVKCLSSQVSDAADIMSHVSLAEAEFKKQINKLKCEIENANVEVFIREEVYKSILRELMGKIKCGVKDADIETMLTHEIFMTVFSELVRDAEAAISHKIMRYSEEKERRIYLEAMLLESENALLLEIKENEKLKQEKSEIKEEKEKSVSEVSSTLIKQSEQFKLVSKELDKLTVQMSSQERLLHENRKELDLVKSRLEEASDQNRGLKDQTSQQEILLYDIKKESDLMRSRLEEALEQVDLYKVENSKLDQKFKEAMYDLKEAEREKSTLYDVIQENQNLVSATVVHELEQKRRMKSVIVAVHELSEAVSSFESRVMDMISLNNNRFEILNCQFSPLVQQANLLKKKGLLYKRGLELRCSDLKKAEVEVDLLGDQVDELLSLLGKIYIGLDHYLPILQHYPGIMETLELIRRAIGGETSKSL